jgi:hypothetical protein
MTEHDGMRPRSLQCTVFSVERPCKVATDQVNSAAARAIRGESWETSIDGGAVPTCVGCVRGGEVVSSRDGTSVQLHILAVYSLRVSDYSRTNEAEGPPHENGDLWLFRLA